jgi:hypothetical protein
VYYPQKRSITETDGTISNIKYGGVVAWLFDRVRENASVIARAPEASALMAIIVFGISYFALQQFHRERLAVLNDRVASQEALLAEYRTKLKGATPEEAANQIAQLKITLRDTQTKLDNGVKNKPVALENAARDSLRLYLNNTAVASVQEPKFDFDNKTVTFAEVTSRVLLGINKSYEFRDWKLICGGTKVYGDVRTGAVHEFSYSPLTCKIAGNR